MTQDLLMDEGSFAISNWEPQTEFNGNIPVLSFYFSEGLDEEVFGLPELRRFIDKIDAGDCETEVSLTINVNYADIPDGYLHYHCLGGGVDEDDGCFHLKETEKDNVNNMIAGLKEALRKLETIKFHPAE